jgi:UDP-glucose 4-epimerase
MKYIVTGAAGFIGSHLCERLVALGHQVVGIDNLSAGNIHNLKDIPQDDFTLWQGDITSEISMDLLSSTFEICDGIFHLAADARIQPSIENPAGCLQNNIQGTTNILDQLRKSKGVKNIVYSASSSYYGVKNKSPLKEDMPHDCLNAYAISKYVGELLCKMYGNLYNVKNISLKYFNVYGPRSPLTLGVYNPVIGLFFEQALLGKPITVVGDGKQTRDFTYVHDVVLANITAMNSLHERPEETNGYTFNIGTGENIEIIKLAERIKKVLDSNVEIKHIPARPGEARLTCADNSLAREKLKWKPTKFLEQTLPILANHYKEIITHEEK